LVLGCVIGLTAVPVALREAFVFIVCTGILSTFSREAMLAATILVGGAMMGRALSTARMFAGAMAIGALYFALHLGTLLDQKKVLNSDTLARLSFQTTDSSANSRVRIAEKTLKQFEDAPILGQGFGTTIYWTDIASHDTYLSLLADFGLLGILVIPTLVYSVRRKTWDFYAFAAIFLSWGFFLHLVLYLNYSLISVAIEADESETFRNAAFENSGEAMFFENVIWER
jgi:O-antigen ligase